MRELLRKDLKLKLISLCFAVLLWIFVVNSINPIDTKIVNVPLEIKNISSLETKNLMLHNPNFQKSINVKVRGRRDALSTVTQNSFTAVLDFSRVTSEEDTQLKVDDVVYLGSENITIESVEPGYITLDLIKIGQNMFRVEVPKAETKEGYELYDASANPSAVLVEGEESIINQIDRVEAVYSVDGPIDRDTVIPNVKCVALDRDGNEISGLDIQSVEVVLRVGKRVSVIADVIGRPADNYIDGAVSVTPNDVLIAADDPSKLEKITSIKTETVDINGANRTVQVNKQLVLEEGIRIAEDIRGVLVTVSIEQLAEKEFTISGNSIAIINKDIDERLTYSITTESIIVKVKGKREELGMLYISDLKPYISVAGLGEGTHQVPLRVNLSGISRLVEEYTVEVKIEKPQTEPETGEE